MADFTITISNRLYPLGPDVCTPSLWGTFQWGGKWLFSATDLITDFVKLVTNSITPSDDYFLSTGKLIDNQIVPDEALVKESIKVVDNSISPSFETSNESLALQSWNYVFTKPSINAEDRTTATFTANSRPTNVWTSITAATSTSWS